MDVKIRYYGMHVLMMPVVFYFIWLVMGKIDSGVGEFIKIFISVSIGVFVSVVFCELFASKITKLYLLVCLLAGLVLVVSFYVLGFDDSEYIDSAAINLGFILTSFSYKKEVPSKLTKQADSSKES